MEGGMRRGNMLEVGGPVDMAITKCAIQCQGKEYNWELIYTCFKP